MVYIEQSLFNRQCVTWNFLFSHTLRSTFSFFSSFNLSDLNSKANNFNLRLITHRSGVGIERNCFDNIEDGSMTQKYLFIVRDGFSYEIILDLLLPWIRRYWLNRCWYFVRTLRMPFLPSGHELSILLFQYFLFHFPPFVYAVCSVEHSILYV